MGKPARFLRVAGRAVYSAATGKYAQRAAGSAAATLGAAAARKMLSMGGRRRGRGSSTVTTQRDSSTTYRSGRRVGGRGSRGFMRKFRRALLSEQPLNVYTSLYKASDTTAVGNQSFGTVYLGDMNTTAQGDIWNVFKDAYTAAAVTDVEQEKLYIRSMSMDLQFKNNGTEQMFVDMYTCVARINHDSVGTLNSDIGGWFGDMSNIGAVSSTVPGITLFNIPGFCRKWKIIKRQTFIVKPDEAVQTTIFGSKNRTIIGRHLQDYRCSLKGFTKAIVLQVRGVPENTASDSGLTGFTYAWSTQTRICYAKPPGQLSETIGQTK